MNEEIGIYIHIPFCKRKCYYCDFVSFEDNCTQEKYIQALIKEIKNWKSQNKDKIIKTLYIGGGTPSFINSKSILEIINSLDIGNEYIERTIEINPGTINKEKLVDYKKAGINRISIGLQSTNDNLLKEIGRIHNLKQFIEAYNLVKEVGFDNINIDLMLGLPNQTLEDIEESLNKILALDVNHISVYSLILEEGTVLFEKIEKNELQLPSEELERKMYWYVKKKLEEKGYIHYEISNFAKKGYESKHNTDCWKQKQYRGFGLAAHSYIDGVRFSNTEDLNKYIENIDNECYDGNIIIQEEKQSEEEKQKEYMLLGLRKIDGININVFENIFKINPIEKFKNEIEKLEKDGLVLINEKEIKLTEKGIDMANLVWEEFI